MAVRSSVHAVSSSNKTKLKRVMRTNMRRQQIELMTPLTRSYSLRLRASAGKSFSLQTSV
jgi:hypothetical protein